MSVQTKEIEHPAVSAPADAVESLLGHLIREANRAYMRALQLRITNHGVSMGQWFFLCALWEEDGLTQRELSQRVGMMEPTTVTALNGMERRGFVERVRNTHDRRKVNIYLTPKGRALRHVLEPYAVELHNGALSGITSGDVSTTLTSLRRMIGNLNRP